MKFHPAYVSETLDEETAPLVAHLAALNRAGFLTDCSQPGLDEGHSKQRAFVIGWALESVAARIERLSLTTDLYVSVARPGQINGCRMPVTIDVFRAFSWAGDSSIDEETGLFDELLRYKDVCGPSAWEDLQAACAVSVIDLCWGRKEYAFRFNLMMPETYEWKDYPMAIGILGLCLGLTVLAGCATEPQPRTQWVRPPGIPVEHARQDADACQRDAELLPRRPMPQPRRHDLREQWRRKADQARRGSLFLTCMRVKGYTWAPAPPED
jgi:hypothetical protein